MESGSEPNKEGEPQSPLFSVQPFFGGYYERFAFTQFDTHTHKWEKPENKFETSDTTPYDYLRQRVLSGKIQGNIPLALPLPDDWVVDASNLVIDNPDVRGEITQNQTGHSYLTILGDGVFHYTLTIAPRTHKMLAQKEPEVAELHGTLPVELVQIISDLKEELE